MQVPNGLVWSVAAVVAGVTAPSGAPAEEGLARTQSGTVTIASGVLYEGCYDLPYGYNIAVTPDQADWYLHVDAVHSDGQLEGGDFLSGRNSAVGTSTVQFCDSAEAGAYILDARLGLFETGPELPDVAFTMRKPYTATTASASAKKAKVGKKLKLKVASSEERATGYGQHIGGFVILERLVNGTWKKVKGSKTYTNNDGRANIRVRLQGKKMKLRGVTPGDSVYDASYSDTVIIKRRK
jgi:hypothetical protein